jgi:tetratricopeptide (TPR) repeat protein
MKQTAARWLGIVLIGSAVLRAQDDRREDVLAPLQEAVRLHPRSPEAYNALGEALETLHDKSAAKEAFEKALAADARFAPAHVSLARLLVEQAQFPAAAGHLDRAIVILGQSQEAAYAHYLRARIYSEQSQVQKALDELMHAVSLRPDFAEAWSDLGMARKTLLDEAGALTAFERAVELKPSDAVAQYRLGNEYLNRERTRDAIQHLEQAMRLNPEDQSTLYSLQAALRKDGQTQRAAEVKQKLADLLVARDRANQNALTAIRLNNQGSELEKSGDLPGALEKYRQALDLYPEHVGIRVNLAIAFLRLGQWNPGLSELKEALRREPGNAQIRAVLKDAISQAPPEVVRK